jgi:MerR family transcriptional regulator, thiopeptide resistance regulator
VTDEAGRWRVGEVATLTGLTVRTLHYYDEIGLVVPSGRSDAGHRSYATGDLTRLFRVCLLRRLGLTLADIERSLGGDEADLQALMELQVHELDGRIGALTRLRRQIAGALDGDPPGDVRSYLSRLATISADTEGINRRITGLVYRDLEGAVAYLERVFGLGPSRLTRDGDGTVVHAEISCGDGDIWLHHVSERFHLESPLTLGAATATMVVMVDDVDQHHAHAVSEGAEIATAPTDQPYGYREYSAFDCEGGLWAFMRPLDS